MIFELASPRNFQRYGGTNTIELHDPKETYRLGSLIRNNTDNLTILCFIDFSFREQKPLTLS